MTRQEKLKRLKAKLDEGKGLSEAEQRFLDEGRTPPKWFQNEEEIAAHFGVTRRALRRWKPAYPEAFEPTAQGYDAAKLVEARARFLADSPNTRLCDGDSAPAAPDKPEVTVADLKLRKMELECDKLATQIDILRGLYVRKSTVVRELRVVLYALKEAFLRIGAEVCYQTSGKTPAEAQEIINEAIRRALLKANEIDFERFEAAIDETGNSQGVKTRMPAARETNGAQKAS